MKGLSLPKLSQLSRRERLFAAVSMLVVMVLLLDRLVLGPWWNHTVRVRQEIQKLEKDLWRHQELLNRSPQILREVELYSEHLSYAEVGAVDMASLLREVEALGIESGIVLNEVKPLPTGGNQWSEAFAFEVSFAATLPEWVHFVHLIQSSKLLFEITRASVEMTDENSPILKGSLRATKRTVRRRSKDAVVSSKGPQES